MTQIVKIIIFIAALFATDTSKAMKEYALLQKRLDSEQKLFILGEVHSGPESRDTQTAVDIQHIMNLIKRAAPQERIALLVEVSETPVDRMDSPPTPVIDVLKNYEKLEDFMPFISVIRADRRGQEEVLIAGALGLISDFSEAVAQGKNTMDGLGALISAATHYKGLDKYSSITVADYLKKLDAQLCSLRTNTNVPQTLIQTTLRHYDLARAEMQQVFASLGTQNLQAISLTNAVFKLFIDCSTFADLTKKIKIVFPIFSNVLAPIADVGFIEKMLSLYNSGTKKIMLAVGQAHCGPVVNICEVLLGFQIKAQGEISNDTTSNAEKRSQFSRDCIEAAKNFLISSDHYCSWCLKKQDIQNAKRCGICKQSLYCGVNCQKQDWPDHKKGCKAGNNH